MLAKSGQLLKHKQNNPRYNNNVTDAEEGPSKHNKRRHKNISFQCFHEIAYLDNDWFLVDGSKCRTELI